MKRILAVVLVVLLCAATLGMTGCSKDGVLGLLNQVMQNLGDNCLSKSYDLEGKRTFYEDSYTGTYEADYHGFTGRETLFGNTGIFRNAGDEIEVKCSMAAESGSARLYYKSGDEGTVVLVDTEGAFDKTIDLPPGSNYIGVVCDHFTGSLELEIK